jgi:hypothetical protein
MNNKEPVVSLNTRGIPGKCFVAVSAAPLWEKSGCQDYLQP